jgi:hypothetical protein
MKSTQSRDPAIFDNIAQSHVRFLIRPKKPPSERAPTGPNIPRPPRKKRAYG